LTGYPQTLNEYFIGYTQSYQLFTGLQSVIDTIGLYELRVTKSQIAFRHGKAFAWV